MEELLPAMGHRQISSFGMAGQIQPVDATHDELREQTERWREVPDTKRLRRQPEDFDVGALERRRGAITR